MTKKHKGRLFPCPCCGSRVLSEVGVFEICHVCHWEDDPTQEADPDFTGGANEMSLNECRRKRTKDNDEDEL